MKKHFLLLLVLFFVFGFSSDSKNEKMEKSKDLIIGPLIEETQHAVFNYYANNEWIIGLEDGSFWRMQVLKSKRQQSWSEWWNNKIPMEWNLGDHFFFDPTEWKGAFSLSVMKADQKFFPRCGHILENKRTGQQAFAEFIPFGAEHIPSLAFAEKFFKCPYKEPTYLTTVLTQRHSCLDNVLVMGDDSVFEIFPFSQNSASWGQWFRGEAADQPDEAFVCESFQWKANDIMQIYFMEDDSFLHSKYVNPKTFKLQKGIFLIENKSKNLLAYAQKLSVSDLVDSFDKYAQQRWNNGYNSGFIEGKTRKRSEEEELRMNLEKEKRQSYEKGYRQGYSKGRDGFLEKANNLPPYNPYYEPFQQEDAKQQIEDSSKYYFEPSAPPAD